MGRYLIQNTIQYSEKLTVDGVTANRSASNPATYFDVNGVMQVLTTANVPRYSYEPSGYTLLQEAAATNYCLNSEDVSSWSNLGITVTINDTTAINGTLTADKITEDITNGRHFAGSVAISATIAGSVYSSCYVKKGKRRYVGIQTAVEGGAVRYSVLFDLDTGLYVTDAGSTGSPSNTGYGIDKKNNGWYRIWTTCVSSGTKNDFIVVYNSNLATPSSWNGGCASYAGSTSEYTYIWGAMVEQGALTSYIPTTTAAVTRNAETINSNTWAAFNCKVQANQALAPAGALTADLIATVAATTNGYAYQQVTATGSTVYNGSVYLKANLSTNIKIRLYDGYTYSDSAITVTTEWVRYSLTHTTDASATYIQLIIGGDSTFAGGEEVYATMAQLTAGAELQDYHKTEAQAPRIIDTVRDNQIWQ